MGPKEIFLMRDVDRLKVIYEVLEGKLKKRVACKQLGLSRRQVIRLCKRVKAEGAGGIIHRLRGKASNHRLAKGLMDKATELVKKEYPGFGPTFANEKLREEHGIVLGVNTLREAMILEGLWMAKSRKARHRCYRERRACVGELVQLDGSFHRWFGDGTEKCVLLIYIDDATSRILYGEFVPSEDTLNLMRTTRIYLKCYGRPVALYVDKDSIFRINRQPTIEEQLRDSQPMTQFARAMQELNIEIIFANSPQAKGRVERGFRTHQDRLVKELSLKGIRTIPKANEFLWTTYIPKHNARFTVKAANATDAHRPLLKNHHLEEILSLRTQRTLLNDLTLRFNNYFLQVLPDRKTTVRRKDKVLVEVRLDNSIHLRFKDTYLDFKAIAKPPAISQQTPTISKPRKPPVPTKDHPWRHFKLPREVFSRLNAVKAGGEL